MSKSHNVHYTPNIRFVFSQMAFRFIDSAVSNGERVSNYLILSYLWCNKLI
jgi:hypothetical protein